MDEIEVLIKISKEDYEFIYDEFADGDMPDGKSLTRTILYAIAKGTVLPKGHGELKDINEIWRLYENTDMDYTMFNALDDAPIVVEADKEIESDD